MFRSRARWGAVLCIGSLTLATACAADRDRPAPAPPSPVAARPVPPADPFLDLGPPAVVPRVGYVGIDDFALSPDGRLALAADSEGEPRIWDLSRRAIVGVLRRFPESACCRQKLEFSRDGGLMTSSGASGFGVWDAATGAPLATVRSDEASFELVPAPDGAVVVTYSSPPRPGEPTQVVSAVDARTGRTLWTLAGASVAAVSPRGDVMATVTEREVVVVETRTGRARFATPRAAELPGSVRYAVAAGGGFLARRTFDGARAGLVDVHAAGGREMSVATCHGAFDWSPTASHLIACDHLIDAVAKTSTKLPFAARTAVWSPDGSHVVVRSEANEMVALEVATGRLHPLLATESAEVSFSPDGSRVMLLPAPGTPRLYRVGDWAPVEMKGCATANQYVGPLCRVAWDGPVTVACPENQRSPNRRLTERGDSIRVCRLGEEGAVTSQQIVLNDLATEPPEKWLAPEHDAIWLDCAGEPGGPLASALLTPSGVTHPPDPTPGLHPRKASSAWGPPAFAPRGDLVVRASREDVAVWRSPSGALVGTIPCSDCELAFDPDGSRLATCDADRKVVEVRDATTLALHASVPSRDCAFAWRPGTTMLAVADPANRGFTLLDVVAPAAQTLVPTGAALVLQIAPDGKTVYLVDEVGDASVYTIPEARRLLRLAADRPRKGEPRTRASFPSPDLAWILSVDVYQPTMPREPRDPRPYQTTLFHVASGRSMSVDGGPFLYWPDPWQSATRALLKPFPTSLQLPPAFDVVVAPSPPTKTSPGPIATVRRGVEPVPAPATIESVGARDAAAFAWTDGGPALHVLTERVDGACRVALYDDAGRFAGEADHLLALRLGPDLRRARLVAPSDPVSRSSRTPDLLRRFFRRAGSADP